jgi:NAD(P)-dependent dehydrogenase (short-subunit alcohol dehydrogenase family)
MKSLKKSKGTRRFPPQHQKRQPGRERQMRPRPQSTARTYRAANRLSGKVALITGGDSGIGRAVAIAFAKEGADVAVVYLEEHGDANDTKRVIEGLRRRCLLISGDVGDATFCAKAIEQVVRTLGGLNVVVNNAAEQHVQDSIEDISEQQLLRTFRTNVFSMFFMTKAALPHLHSGDAIVNTTSVTAYRGSPRLLDYSATKGAIVSMTRSLAKALVTRKIRVNAVAPGPIWTPLIPSSFSGDHVESFGADVPMNRAGQPDECAPAYVFLASDDSSYMTGQVLHPNGGEIING